MNAVQIGNGNVARMHREIFSKNENVSIIAVVEISSGKRAEAEKEGLLTFPDIDSLLYGLSAKVDFWDICTPDESHLPVMKVLLEKGAQKILVEKPICVPSQIQEMENLLNIFPEKKICVEETYVSSRVIEIVRELSNAYGMLRPDILVEQSKNRMQDIIGGRFIDKELGVFALEVPHSLTIVAGTGNKRRPAIIQKVLLEDMTLPTGEVLLRQGKGKISYLTEDGCQVEICSAMNGDIFYPLPEINAQPSIPFGSPVRYRILVLEEGNCKIIGQFEPISDWPRFQARVLGYKNGDLRDKIKFEDKPMGCHIAKIVSYFNGERENPASPKEALSLVKFLKEVMEKLGT